MSVPTHMLVYDVSIGDTLVVTDFDSGCPILTRATSHGPTVNYQTANYTLTALDSGNYVFMDTTGLNNMVATLPPLGTITGNVMIKAAGPFGLTVATPAGVSIDRNNSVNLNTNESIVVTEYNGSYWVIGGCGTPNWKA